jgi:hypothetical protein
MHHAMTAVLLDRLLIPRLVLVDPYVQAEAVQRELDRLGATLRQIEAYNESMKGEIAVTRRAAYAAEEAMQKLEKEKQQQDYLIDDLQVRLQGGLVGGVGTAAEVLAGASVIMAGRWLDGSLAAWLPHCTSYVRCRQSTCPRHGCQYQFLAAALQQLLVVARCSQQQWNVLALTFV